MLVRWEAKMTPKLNQGGIVTGVNEPTQTTPTGTDPYEPGRIEDQLAAPDAAPLQTVATDDLDDHAKENKEAIEHHKYQQEQQEKQQKELKEQQEKQAKQAKEAKAHK
jgi:hypothetical protein